MDKKLRSYLNKMYMVEYKKAMQKKHIQEVDGEVEENIFRITERTRQFYKKNRNIHFAVCSEIMVDFLESLSTNMVTTMNNSIQGQMINSIETMGKRIETMNLEISNKMNESKRDYFENIRLILANETMTMAEKVHSIVEKNNESLLLKTRGIVSDIVPKSQETYARQIDDIMKQTAKEILQETRKLPTAMEKKDKDMEAHILASLESQVNKMIASVQTPLFSLIQSNEEKSTNHFQKLRDMIVSQQTSQDSTTHHLNQFLNKYQNNSTTKGQVSETELYCVLQQVFPTDEIIRTAKESASGDYIVQRKDPTKPAILFENKNYITNVDTMEVDKFKRDLQAKRMHGIMISQKSNITYKSDYEIEVIDGLIHMYLPNLNYQQDKVKVAVDVIDNMSRVLSFVEEKRVAGVHVFTEEQIEKISEDYNQFIKKKMEILEIMKSNNKSMTEALDNLHMDSVRLTLTEMGLHQDNESLRCKNCTFVGKNKGSLSAHVRNCKVKKTTI